MKRSYLTLLAALLWASGAQAADIASDVQTGSTGSDDRNGGYFEFGIAIYTNVNRKKLNAGTGPWMAGAYRYRRFFLEAINPWVGLATGAVNGIALGANLWRNNRWEVDLLAANMATRSLSGSLKIDDLNSPEADRERDLIERDSFYSGAGLRLTGYFGNTIVQFRLVDDTHGGNGVTSSARLAYSQQLKNWNLHGVISANYASRKTSQFWYGISSEEATTRFPQYEFGSSTINYGVELGATYPLRENIVFRTSARYTQIADSTSKSPLEESTFGIRWNSIISYVF